MTREQDEQPATGKVAAAFEDVTVYFVATIAFLTVFAFITLAALGRIEKGIQPCQQTQTK